MKTRYTLLYALMLILCASCTTTESPEVQATAMLQKSRQHLLDRRYDAARDSIFSMRRQFPTALQSRAEGILLLDSIEMIAAQDSMGSATGDEWKRLSVKVQFFERKLQEDIRKLAKQ
ncbi:MAG: hypothetical protein IIV13_03070 [Bacteroidaceae bacterium]|nr:hypothetical protein [Bacteroidaceae bacterium]